MIRPLPLLLLAALGIALPVHARANEEAAPLWENIETVEFISETFNRPAGYVAVVPPGLCETDRPFLLFLHGRGRNKLSLVEIEALREQFLKTPFVTILPDGEDGWYLNSPVNPAAAYADLLDEIIRSAETRYNLSSDPWKRAIAGWSMGGYGAAITAIRRNDFRIFASIIGLLDFPRPAPLPEDQNYVVPARTFGEDPQVWASLNPANRAPAFAGTAILLVIAENAFDRTMNENFLEALTRENIATRVEKMSGGHSFVVVRQAVPAVLAFTANHLQKTPAKKD